MILFVLGLCMISFGGSSIATGLLTDNIVFLVFGILAIIAGSLCSCLSVKEWKQ